MKEKMELKNIGTFGKLSALLSNTSYKYTRTQLSLLKVDSNAFKRYLSSYADF